MKNAVVNDGAVSADSFPQPALFEKELPIGQPVKTHIVYFSELRNTGVAL